MMAVLFFAIAASFVLLPAVLAWLLGFYIAGHREHGAAAALYGGNVVLGVAMLWLAIRFVPFFSLLGQPDPRFYVPVAMLGALIGTASAQRMTRPPAPRPSI
jgi:hypothetical protein